MSGLVGYGSSDEGDDQREADEGSVVDVGQIVHVLGIQPPVIAGLTVQTLGFYSK